MPHRELLRSQLQLYIAQSESESAIKDRMLNFMESHADCFERSLQEGHFTASAWILSKRGDSVLLAHHRKLGKWVQLGGHADGETDLLKVALKEAQEESGLKAITVKKEAIFDIDIHAIPAHEEDPLHFHYDIRYLFSADEALPLVVNHESNSLEWFPLNKVRTVSSDPSIERMVKKSLLSR